MTDLVRISVVLCALVGCFYCWDNSDDGVKRKSPYDGPCLRDNDCITNAFCRVQQTCQCEPYHTPSRDRLMCIPTVGRFCTNDTTCAAMMNAECQLGSCICKDNFIQDIRNASRCISRPVKIGDECQSEAVCKEKFNFANCIDGKCQCYTSHHYSNETQSCIKSKGLFFSCLSNHECYLDSRSLDVLECKQERCVCKEGEQCYSKGSLITATRTLMMALLAFLQQGVI